MKRPLGIVALLYAGGLLAAQFFQPPLTVLYPVSLSVALGAIAFARIRAWLLWPLVVLAGWTNMVSHTAIISPNDLRVVLSPWNDLVDMRGKLVERPETHTFLAFDQVRYTTMCRLEVSEVRQGGAWKPGVGTVAVLTRGLLPTNYFSGQSVEIHGLVEPPPGPVAEGLFDFGRWLTRHAVYFEVSTKGADDWKLVPPTLAKPPFSDRFIDWARATLSIDLPFKDEPLELLWAMTLRWKADLTDEMYKPFMESGTMHIFAISGLHIALIAGFLISALRTIRLRREWCGAVVIPIIWFYTAATGWQSSAVRAAVMTTVVTLGWSMRQPSNLMNSLGAAALLILIFDPRQLFQAGFQLSFFVMAGMALVLPRLKDFSHGWFRPDPMLAGEMVPLWRRRLNWVLRYLLGLVTISTAAWLASWPLTAYYFHIFSPVTVLANMIVVPLSSTALACNVGGLVCGSWLPWATALFNHSAWFWMKLSVQVSMWAAKLPGGFWYVSAPSLITFVVYYTLLAGTLSGWLFARERRVWAGVVLALVAGGYFWQWEAQRSRIDVTVLPVNGGCSVVVRGSETMVFDTGSSNTVRSIVEPYLQAQGVNRISDLVLTHANTRQVGGTPLLCETIPVQQIVTGNPNPHSTAYRKLLPFLQSDPGRWKTINRGDVLDGWTILHPASDDKFAQGDDAAIVARSTMNGTRVLLLSDLGSMGQAKLLSRESDLRVDIVVATIPDKGEPLSDALLDVIQPRLIIVVDANLPVSRRSSPALIRRLGERSVPVLVTRDTQAITLSCDSSGWQLRAMNGIWIRGEPGKPATILQKGDTPKVPLSPTNAAEPDIAPSDAEQ